jgi:hypothetical protein
MATIAYLIELPDLSRGPLSAGEIMSVPDDGIHLSDERGATGTKCPRSGFIRQSLVGWWWHPTVDHAQRTAARAGRRTIIIGQDEHRDTRIEWKGDE